MDKLERLASTLKLRQLQYFLAVAENLHFTEAANRLFVTQPTLSHQIAELESRIGTPLFDRVGKTVRLTQAGALFRTFASRALKELEAGCAALSELEGLARGDLRVGVIQSFSRTLLPPILGSFIRNNPALHVFVEEMPANVIEQRLSQGTLDIGIAFAPGVLEETECEPLLKEQMLVVVGAAHAFAKRRSIEGAELDGQLMALLSADFTTRRLIDQYLEQVGARAMVVCDTNSMEVMLGAVTTSNLVTIIPERALGPKSRRNLRVLQLRSPALIRTSALLWPRHSFRTAAARTFGEMVRKQFLKVEPLLPKMGK